MSLMIQKYCLVNFGYTAPNKQCAQYTPGFFVPGHFLQEVFLGADFNGQLPMCRGVCQQGTPKWG